RIATRYSHISEIKKTATTSAPLAAPGASPAHQTNSNWRRSMSGTSDFGTFGRYTELPLDKMTAEQKRAYEFTVKQRGEVPGPYKIWSQNPKLIEVMVPLGNYYQHHSSLSKAEIEIATNLTNAKWLAGYS